MDLGLILAGIGLGLMVGLAGAGSAIGLVIGGTSAIGSMKKKPEGFGSYLVLSGLPATQGLYGFVSYIIWSGSMNDQISVFTGSLFLASGFAMGLVGLVSAIQQGKVWAAGRYKGTNYDYLLGKTVPLDEPYIFQKEKDQRADFGLAGGLGIEYRFLEHWAVHLEGRCYYSFISNVKQYMEIKDYRFNTTLGMNIGFAYIFN